MKSAKNVLKGAKKSWSGVSKKGNRVNLLAKKGVSGINTVSYKTDKGRRLMVITTKVYKLGK